MSTKSLSQYLDQKTIASLHQEIEKGRFGKITLEQAMKFILTDGVLPASNLPAQSFLNLEDWLRGQTSPKIVTTTELKNETGRVIESILRGETVKIKKHGRIIGEIIPIAPNTRDRLQ